MAGNRLVIEGLAELRAALRALPAELTGEGGHIVEGRANRAATTVRTVYGKHRISGRLQDGLTVQKQSAGQFGAAWVVKSASPIAWLFDNGSQARHWANKKSTGVMWGKTSTPPTHTFSGTMARERRSMYGELSGLLTRNGLVVSGEP